MFPKILFPVDLSENMHKTLPYVLEMADKFGSEIHCVYCLHMANFYVGTGISITFFTDFENTVYERVKIKLEKFTEENFNDRIIHTKILNGRPGDKIVEYACSEQLDLVIMGHNSTGIERAILGSVAGHVVKYSPVPVMVICPEVLKK